ncbi:MAG TPA: DEAD/DEAH box helicase [Syntrophobacteraceae bacterium]|nr:DEAD/DEAH box helicase [Syntrophobacteraceae bacterium]
MSEPTSQDQEPVIQRYLQALLHQERADRKVLHHAVLPAREAQHANPAIPLPETLGKILARQGITRLYSHQAAAIEHIRAGRNVVVATPTSSGKSLIYNLSVTERLLKEPGIRALYLFPIKALIRDQLANLEALLKTGREEDPAFSFTSAVYDGDIPPYQRSKIRRHPPHILLSNPDMLHYALLPFHHKWETFWKSLRFVVIDEMHTYRGIFGSQVSQVFRRLQRICRYYGSSPQFIFLSATIANPGQLAGQLVGDFHEFEIVRENGAPQAQRHFIFLETGDLQATHASGVAARLVVQAARMGLKTIAFTQSRRLTELVHLSVMRMDPRLAKRVSSYRAGFLPEERRSIEQKLAGGSLDAVISTSALELGIDIGGLDVCILVGYPGTVMTTWQRGGRVGRSGRESAIILLPQSDALDQYIAHHPREFLESPYEIAVTDPFNPEILKAHLPCAAAEEPLERLEREFQGEAYQRALNLLTQGGRLHRTSDGNQWISGVHNPHRRVDIRSVGASFAILRRAESPGEKSIPLGKNEGIRALRECHPGAVYLHRGESYQVESLDLEKRVIQVTQCNVPYFTRVKTDKETEILEILASKPSGNFLIRLGRLKVTEHILGYEKRRLFSQELLGTSPLDLPPQEFETVGFWVEIEPSIAASVQKAQLHFMGGIHAVEHAMISIFPLFALCDRNDIGGISCPQHPQVGKGAIFIYDGYPGGIGLAARGYEIILPLLEKTRELIASCGCQDGCPACIHSPKCGSGNKPLDKGAALSVLRYLVGEWKLTEEIPQETGESPADRKARPHAEPEERPPRMGFLDLETQRLADEVGGWGNKHLMGISVAVVYDTEFEDFRVYREEEVPALVDHLEQLDLVVGFNILSFDYAVLQAYTSVDLNRLPTVDILKEIHAHLGFRVGLHHLAEKTLGKAKGADGVQAVRWFRQGAWDSLIEYCMLDVALTRDLFQHALDKGYLVYQNREGQTLRIPTPWASDRVRKAQRKTGDSR